MAQVRTALRALPVPVLLALFVASCATNLGIEKRDGWPDAQPDEGEVDSEDVPADDVAVDDVAVDDGPLPDCGNGTIDEGEDCDGDAPRDCTTTCGSTGTETCVGCLWSACVPPCEICNGVDDDCDDVIDESGEFAPGAPVRVSDDPASSTQAALAWTGVEGTEFGLVWVDEREGQQDLYSAIVEAGPPAVVSAQPFLTADTAMRGPAVLWENDVFNVVATDQTGSAGRHVFCQRMGTDGAPMGVMRTAGSSGSVDLHAPALAARGGGFAITWDSSFMVHLVLTNALCNPTGEPIDLLTDGDVSRDARIASSSGPDHGVVWVDERDGNPEIYAAVVNGSGPLCEVRLTDDAADSKQPDVVWDGSAFAVAWSDERTDPASLFLTRFNLTCTEPGLGEDVQITHGSEAATAPSIAWTGSALGVAWEQGGGIHLQAFVGEGHPLLCEEEISGGGNSKDPALVVTDTGFGVAWNDDREGNEEIYLSIVSHEDCP